MISKRELKYRFDTFMGKGGGNIFLSLTLVFLGTFLFIALARGLLVWFTGFDMQHKVGFWGNAYIIFLELTDPGNMAQDIYSSPWYKVTGILAGIAGLIMLSSLIAFITTALDQKLNELKRGHSKVIEEDHTLILGWDEQRIVEVVKELIMANESEKDACVVILADKDKEAMDDLIKLRLKDTCTTRIVTRSGNTSSLANLDTVSVETCKAMIVLANCNDMGTTQEKATSDAKVIQTILALTTFKKEQEDAAIVAEIFNPTHRHIIENSFPENVVTVDTGDILAKLLVQTSRSVGLSVVYNEILSFDGCEMYFFHDDWGEITFGKLAYHFPDGVPMGVRQNDGTLLMNPSTSYKMQKEDEILIVADDDSTIEFCKKAVAQPTKLQLAGGRLKQKVEKELILGWTHKGPTVLEEYADYVKEGSQIDILIQSPSEKTRAEIEETNRRLPTVNISLIEKNRLDLEDLMSLQPFTYDNIIILAEGGSDTEAHSVDSENIVTLLLLRDIFEQHPKESENTKLITEVLDSQNHHLISRAGVKDVIISNRLVSMILAQLSESRKIKEVYDDIFQEDGSEIYLKPATLYFKELPTTTTFATMMDLAQQREEVCLGVKLKSLEESADDNYGIDLIPFKNTEITLCPEDSFVVLAEDEF